MRTVTGIEALLTVPEVAALIKRPQRYVRELIKAGALRGVKLGGNSWRVAPAEFRRWLDAGAPSGFRHARSSGGIRPGMVAPRRSRGGGVNATAATGCR